MSKTAIPESETSSASSCLYRQQPAARDRRAEAVVAHRGAGILERGAVIRDGRAQQHFFERPQFGEARVLERARDEGGGLRPARGVERVAGEGCVAKECGEGDIRERDRAEQKSVWRQLAFEVC